MELDTNTKKKKKSEIKSDLDRLLDLYWGGSERHITGLTLRIIGVNIIAVLVLMGGVLYLSQYQNDLIESKLQAFRTEVEVIAAGLSESAIVENTNLLDRSKTNNFATRLSNVTGQNITIFDKNQNIIAKASPATIPQHKEGLRTLRLLRAMAGAIINLIPQKNTLPIYPTDHPPGIEKALGGKISFTAWQGKKGNILLSSTAPLSNNHEIVGAVLLGRTADDVTRAVGDVWINILQIFIATLVTTILLSIYLSGVIARPLRLLTKSAEAVRMDPSQNHEIPDLSDRHDEIGELSLVMRDMTKALWSRMDSIERFSADVAHELKNPLTSLKSAAETATKIKKPKDRDKLMEIIHHDIMRMDRLITDIASVSRLDTELSRQSLEPVYLKPILENLITRHAELTDNVTITLTDNSNGEVMVWGLETRLLQIFENLLNNALSFSKNGNEIKIILHTSGDQVIITIEDQGSGIPSGKLEDIFERFYSERPSHEDYGLHSGLGLFICRQITRALGGQIVADNVHDESGAVTGAKFTLILKSAE